MKRFPFCPITLLLGGTVLAAVLIALPNAAIGQGSPRPATQRPAAKQPSAQQHPRHDAMLADRCRELLDRSITDFYLPHCVDQQHGGYLEVLDDDGNFAADGNGKFLTLQARQLWYFSTLAASGIRKDESLQAAKSGYQFLQDHFHDSVHGGYYAKTSRQGEVTDRRKHIYPNAFVIYALVQYARAINQSEPLEQAMKLFTVLENNAYDEQHGGYQEFFYRDWKLIVDPHEAGYVGAINTKTYNSHLHILEAFAQLYRDTKDRLVGDRLAELIQINTVTVKHPRHPCNIDGWHPDWQMIDAPQNLRASYGHDVECAWLVIDAAEALGRQPDTLIGWAKSLCDHAINRGFDREHGGFFYSGPLGKPSDDHRKEWWTQSEALVAMLTMHRLTGEEKYRRLFDRTFRFVEAHHVAPQGGWWATLQENGSLGDRRSRTSMWQGAYHNGRALLLCEKLLRGNP